MSPALAQLCIGPTAYSACDGVCATGPADPADSVHDSRVVAHNRHRTQKSIHYPKLNRAGVVVEFARVEQAFVQRLAKFSDKGINTSARKVRRCEYTMHQIAKVVSDSVRIKLEKGRAIAVGLTCSLFLGKHA